MARLRFHIEERFQIAGRGTAIVIAETTALPVGRALKATVIRPDGTTLEASATKELLLRRTPRPIEKEAFMLKDVLKAQIPERSDVEIEEP